MDWFIERNKSYYGKFLDNVNEAPPTFEDELAEEARLVGGYFARKDARKVSEKYIEWCNATLQQEFTPMNAQPSAPDPQAGTALNFLPSTPVDANALVVAPGWGGRYHIPVPTIALCTASRGSKFVFDPSGSPNKRIRGKTSLAEVVEDCVAPAGEVASSTELPSQSNDQGVDDPMGHGPRSLGSP